MSELSRVANDSLQPGRSDHVRLAGQTLDLALDAFAGLVDERFLHTRSRDRRAIFDALARDQLVNGPATTTTGMRNATKAS